jgi:hypothetical protein
MLTGVVRAEAAYTRMIFMALSDTFVRQLKLTSSGSSKFADGQGMYLLVNAADKYWRLDYRFNGKRKTAALGIYPEVSLAKARQRRREARELLADGIGPSAAKRISKEENLIRISSLAWHQHGIRVAMSLGRLIPAHGTTMSVGLSSAAYFRSSDRK